MTRVNVGISPTELCDQHLIAEYRELPRVFAYKNRTLPGPFRLGKGHVIWCSQFPGTMADRYRLLVAEMRFRGFTVNYPEPRGDGAYAPANRVVEARPIVQERIQTRLKGMPEAHWTRRDVPPWAK